MGRQARFVNWLCSSYLYVNTQKTILINSTYFKTIIKFLTLQNFCRYSVFRYFVTLFSNTLISLFFQCQHLSLDTSVLLAKFVTGVLPLFSKKHTKEDMLAFFPAGEK